MRAAAVILCLVLTLSIAHAGLYVWVDEEGRTHVTDDPAGIPEAMRERAVREGAEVGELWADGLTGPPVRQSPGGSSSDEDRALRLLRGAVGDLGRGETARATAALESVLRLEPARPEAHWYLALVDRQRGRFDSAHSHLEAFLASAGDDLQPWRESARRRLGELEDERRLEEERPARGPLRLLTVEGPHFRIRYDAELALEHPDYVDTVVRYLEDARADLAASLELVPSEPTRVVLYGKAAYLQAWRHRFSFQTVGFFDGRIHVVSAAHPGGELRSLLFHEYTHALFRERVGGDRPFWLNEGLAELAERSSRRQPALSRGELSRLRDRVASGGWIPLHRLGPGFAGLSDAEARLAYLQAAAAVAWIEQRSDRAQRARLLSLLGEGRSADEALRAVLGVDEDGLDGAVRAEILSAFPEIATPAGASP